MSGLNFTADIDISIGWVITSPSTLTCRQRSFTNHRLAINFRLSEQSLLLCFRRTINHGGRVAVCCTTHCILFISSVQTYSRLPSTGSPRRAAGCPSVCLSVLTNRWRERASERTIHWRELLTPAEMIVWSVITPPAWKEYTQGHTTAEINGGSVVISQTRLCQLSLALPSVNIGRPINSVSGPHLPDTHWHSSQYHLHF